MDQANGSPVQIGQIVLLLFRQADGNTNYQIGVVPEDTPPLALAEHLLKAGTQIITMQREERFERKLALAHTFRSA